MNKIYCFGFLFFSKNTIRKFFSDERSELIFVRTASKAIKKGFDQNAKIASWGKRGEDQAQLLSQQFGVDVWRVEDGFIRSAGLGSDYSPPASLVIDKLGIYYDPTQPCELENLLQVYKFSDSLLDRAKIIRQLLVEQSISKYNLGSSLEVDFKQSIKDKVIILVPGQVEDDASIKKGTHDIKSNTELIKKTRSLRPNGFLIYKPHPDVISGNRVGHVDRLVIEQYCDAMLDDVSITDCLALVDEVHTMTSLVGLEALMRGCRVYCYGLPFYAGWGLTDDQYSINVIDDSEGSGERRTRCLSLDELIAATYILYPRYMNWETDQYDTPEHVIERMSQSIHQQGGKQVNKVSHLRRQCRKLMNMGYGFLKGL